MMRLLVSLVLVPLLAGCASFEAMVARSLREQGVRNEAVKPLLDTVVTKKLKIGDSVDQAKKVLTDAGLEFAIDKIGPPVLRSIYRTGSGCGFTIVLGIDAEQRISKIDVREFYTGP